MIIVSFLHLDLIEDCTENASLYVKGLLNWSIKIT